MAQLVGQSLHVIRLQSGGVMNHVVVGRCNSTLADRLRDQEEVIPSKHIIINSIIINAIIINVHLVQWVDATVPWRTDCDTKKKST